MNEIEKLQNEIGVLDEKLDYLVSYNKIGESGEKSWNYKIKKNQSVDLDITQLL